MYKNKGDIQVREPWGLIARVGTFFHIVNSNEPILLLLQASLNTTNNFSSCILLSKLLSTSFNSSSRLA